ncbi:MAG: AAA family ATPase [Bacteroidales bacterium]|jgi:hypothetical protein|nr:AAA family ATPase [Bacteroidales bacterium]
MNIPTPLTIGHSFFDAIIEKKSYYVDKTLIIKYILDNDTAVTLCTRPRRFGKTLNQTMLKCFFEDTSLLGGKDTRALFTGLKIESAVCEEALKQIADNNYAAYWEDEGYTEIIKYGIGFYRKRCMVISPTTL